uniref:Abnormal spindle microtubule assembly n=1 Tax=Cyprinus carpio TaxID=7962 RepID=A0A8C2A7X9_CYPCA
MSFKVAKAECLDFSPTFDSHCSRDKPGKENNTSIPVLSLVQFSRSPFVSFGTIKLGSSKSLPLRIENPTEDQKINIIHFPLIDRRHPESYFSIFQPEDSIILTVTWTPVEEGGVRELLCFIANGIVKHQAILLGKAEATKKKKKTLWDSIKSKKGVPAPSKEKKVSSMPIKSANKTFHVSRQSQYRKDRTSNPLSQLNQERSAYCSNATRVKAPSSTPEMSKPAFVTEKFDNVHLQKNSPVVVLVPSLSSSSRKPTRIVAVAQANLTFMKPTQTAIPRHPLPFAAKNMFYDERWIEKQERGFTWWMNYVLTPDDFKVATEVTKVNALSLTMGNDKFNIPKAPTKEEMSFRTYTARQRLNRLRRAACKLFTSETMVKAIQRLELEVEAKRLLVRKDRHLWKDIGERQKVVNWLISYNPLWLRIGLETIYGELISLESNSDVMGLAMFILGRVLWNPDLAAEFRHPKVPHLYRDGHEEALSRFTLKKLILLVCFLDKAKESRLIEHDPCLFCMDAEFKSSKDLLLAFSRDFLSGEGILSRHLSHLGLAVSHVQTPLDEFNFAVKKLAVDLRCGICLVRVMELFTLDWTLSRKLRIPAISRLQKVHNVDVALQVLKDKGVDLRDEHGANIDSRDIVDGHREKTLNLLWKIIFAFQVSSSMLLDENQLKEEISFLRKTWRTKQKLASLMSNSGVAVTRMKARQAFEHPSQKVTLLMDWVSAVCEFYSLKVENFTVSFSDGRILCYLIHHYHPGHLPAEEIQQRTTQTIECGHRGRMELNNSSSDSDHSFENLELLENERSNFQLVNTAVSYLGGVPAMINPEDMSNTIPNEKVVMCYLSFLCARLLDLRNETRAARVIQGAWRRYKIQKDIELIQVRKKNLAATKIQAVVRKFILRRRMIQQNKAAIRIQTFWRGYVAREKLRVLKKEKQFAIQNHHHAALLIQTAFRRFMAQRQYLCLRRSTIVLQQRFRAKVLGDKLRQEYMDLKLASVTIQAIWRGRAERRKISQLHRFAKIIQSNYRRYVAQTRFLEMKQAAIVIQRQYTAFRDGRKVYAEYTEIKRAAIVLQSAYRGKRARQELQKKNKAVTLIQSVIRAYSCRQRFLALKRAAIVIQQHHRAFTLGRLERSHYVHLRQATITLQAMYRGSKVRQNLRQEHQAATIIQAQFRMHKVRIAFLASKCAAIIIQQQYRAYRVGKHMQATYLQMKNAAVVIQSAFRGMKVRSYIRKSHQAATLIQAHFRGHSQLKRYQRQQWAASVLQQRFRAVMTKNTVLKEYIAIKTAAIRIQSAFRGMIVRKQIAERHKSAKIIQRTYRAYKQRRDYLTLRNAIIRVQQQYRAIVSARLQCKRYCSLRSAAITLQSMYRGMKVRKEIDRKHKAASVIQAMYKMYRTRVPFQAMKLAALVIQRQYRCHLLRKEARENFLKLRRSATAIQAIYRGNRTRRDIARMNFAATVIQRKYLAYRQRKSFLSIRAAVEFCQRHYRSVLVARRDRRDYFAKRQAVVAIQATFRGMQVRRQIRREHEAATIIQSHVRKHILKLCFQRLQRAVCTVQQRFRANKMMRREMAALQEQKSAALILQAAYRGMKSRQTLKQMHQAATSVQVTFRAYSARKRYLAMKCAAIVIQRQYTAFRDGRKVYKEYIEMKRAAIVLQSAYRGKRARQELQKKNKAATLIQSVIRAHSCRQRFLALKRAAIVIQQHHRAFTLGRLERSHYVHLRQATITLQAIYRGSKVRQNLRQEHQAATIIQAQFRMHKVRVGFLAAKCAAIIIQQQYRAYRVGKHMQATYLQMKNAAIVIQSAFRGMKVRSYLRKSHQAATLIQAHFRGHSQLKRYQRQQWAASVLQQRFRAVMTKNTVMKEYIAIKTAAIRIQSAFRGMMVRKQIAEKHKSAKIIQRTYRAYKQRRDYLTLRNAIIRVQQQYRAIVSARLQCKRYCSLRSAAITLQSMYRGMKVRKEIDRKHKAASVIQAMYKMYRTRVPFQAMKLAALVIQRQYRCHLLRKEARENFLKLRRSTTAIQAIYRGNRTRRDIARMNFAATVIQRKYLAYRQRKSFLSIKAAVEFCQRHYRSVLVARRDRRDYFAKRQAVVTIQATFRGMQVRRQIRREHEAATIIQSHMRKHILKLHFQRLRRAVCTVQQRFRANKMMRREMAALQEQKCAALILQAAYRGMKSRQTLKQMHQAATSVQATFRAYSARKRYLAMKCAAIVIQQRFRATKVVKQQRKHFLEMYHGALVLQACYRGLKVRRQLLQQRQAAVLIQSYFRKHKEVVKYQAMRLSAIIIQSHYRSYIQARADRENYLRFRKSAIVLQAAFRGHSLRRQLAEKQEASIIIQAAFRMYQQRSAFKRHRWAARVLQQRFRALKLRDEQMRRYQQVRNATVCLQKSFRGMKGRELARQSKAARTIQSYLRMAVQRQRFFKEKAAAITIQSAYRGHCARVQHARMQANAAAIQKWRLAKRRRAAIKIQSVMRMHVHRKRYVTLRSSVLNLQAHYRMSVAQRRYRRLQAATVTLQKHYRAHRATLEQRSSYLKTLQTIKILQARVRGHIEYRRFQRLRATTITIQVCKVTRRLNWEGQTFFLTCKQAHYRGLIERRRFQQLKESVLVIQKYYRAFRLCQRERAQFLQLRKSAVVIQALWRGWLARRQASCLYIRLRFTAAVYHHLCAIRIQRAVRAHWALKSAKRKISSVLYIQQCFRAKLQRKRYLKDREDIIKTQKAVRTWLHRRNKAAATIQHEVRKLLLRRRKERLQRGIIMAQALWRGHCSRKHHDTSKVISMRRRLREVNQGVKEEDKLCNKTTTALSYLLGFQNYAYILAALKHLETATRLSPECCERLVESGATHTIFTLIRSCNRSVPSMEIITLSIQVLLNLSKYNRTIDAVYDVDNSVETLLDLLQIYREKAGDKVAEKGGSIFTKACFLLVLLVQDERRAMEVRRLTKVSDRIRSIYRLTLRKYKMDAERNKVKQKMNTSLNGSFLLQATPRKSKPVARFDPDWVLRRDKLKDIVDPLRAIQMLANALAIMP